MSMNAIVRPDGHVYFQIRRKFPCHGYIYTFRCELFGQKGSTIIRCRSRKQFAISNMTTTFTSGSLRAKLLHSRQILHRSVLPNVSSSRPAELTLLVSSGKKSPQTGTVPDQAAELKPFHDGPKHPELSYHKVARLPGSDGRDFSRMITQ